jgi:glutaconate CoA-transferase, subunit B
MEALLLILRGLSVDDALKEMEFTPLVAEPVDELLPPTAEELRILREEIDPDRTIIGAAGD